MPSSAYTFHLAPSSPLFPYTTLFRSVAGGGAITLGKPGGSVGVVVPCSGAGSVCSDSFGCEVSSAGDTSGGSWRTTANSEVAGLPLGDRKSTRLNSSDQIISYAVFCLHVPPRTELSPLSLHDALPICSRRRRYHTWEARWLRRRRRPVQRRGVRLRR